MSRRSPVLSLAGISVVLCATTAFTTPARPMRSTPPARVAVAAAVVTTPAAPKALVEEAVNIDWRVLAGLDYTNGKSTDTLKKLEGKLVRIPGFVVPLDDFQEEVKRERADLVNSAVEVGHGQRIDARIGAHLLEVE